VRRLELQEAATGLRLRKIDVERLPQVRVRGEATHQSEVPGIPVNLPNVEVPQPPKDRYEAALHADWLLYDGGVLDARRRIERAQLAVAMAELASELYPLRVEVTESFFTALLLQERMGEVTTLIEDLGVRLSEVRAQIRAGAALPGDTAAVRAEMLRVMQERSELAAERRTSLGVLGMLTGREISETDPLALPDLSAEVVRVRIATEGQPPRRGAPAALQAHPQYTVFAVRRERLEREAALIRARSRPQASAFGQLAYGRPGLKQFTDEFHDYWLAGVRLQWVPWDWGTTGREREALRIQQQIVDTEEAAFSERVQRQVQRPLQAMQRLQAALEMDEQIIALREQVERQARVQFAERVILAAAYMDIRTDLQEARLARHRHRVELARARAEYLTTLGVELR
jgi:outer membrane protein TolC